MDRYLQTFSREWDQIEQDRRLVFKDACFYLSRLSVRFTGSDGIKFLPSYVAEMARNCARQQSN